MGPNWLKLKKLMLSYPELPGPRISLAQVGTLVVNLLEVFHMTGFRKRSCTTTLGRKYKRKIEN